MAWLEGLSSLKGQITNFTKEVLSEGRDEVYETSTDLTESKKKVEELEALCASQDLEIIELRQRIAELQRRLGDGETLNVENFIHQDGFQTLSQTEGEQFGSQDSNNAEILAVLENARHELAENIHLLEMFKKQQKSLQSEKEEISSKCSELEEQVQKLSDKLEKQTLSELNELEQLRDQLRVATEELAQAREENSESLKEQLKGAELRIEELEKELHKVHQQMLDQLSDSQLNTSEIREEVEQTRWQLLQDSGAQKTELLRARQDMVNRIIQMGEKSREVEMNMKKLQLDGKHLTAEIIATIHKLGDPEQQELIHGALKALELENQVLKLRNAQLELAGNTETLKGNGFDFNNKVEDDKKSSDLKNIGSKYMDTCSSKADDDTQSLKSEISELSQMNLKLDTHVSQLQSQVETYERNIECFEMMKLDWSAEKKMLEEHLYDMKGKLKDKEEKLNLVTAQKGLAEVKKQTPMEDNNTELQKKFDEMSVLLSSIQEEKEQLQQGKVCLSSEVEAMAKIIQDLESQLAKSQDENVGLTTSLEELDEQHQDAIDQLLKVKQSLQKQNEELQSELTSVKQNIACGTVTNTKKIDTVAESTNTECLDKVTETDSESKLYLECKQSIEKELEEKILKHITFEIPKDYYTLNNNKSNISPMVTLEALAKMCVECKWKKDTLERKVAELVKELRDLKHKNDERSKENFELHNECRMLKGNVENLIEELMVSKSGGGESLAPIPENSEEAEAMEIRIQTLENEIEILREARTNLEADAERLREEGQLMVKQLEVATASQRNQENLETEARRWQEIAANANEQLKDVTESKNSLELEITKLKDELQSQKVEGQASQQCIVVELQNEVDQKLEVIHDLEQQLQKSETENRNLRKDLEELHKKVECQEKLYTEINTLKEENTRLKEIYHSLEMSQASTINIMNEKTTELKNITSKASEFEIYSQNLEKQLENLSNKSQLLQKELQQKELDFVEIENAKLAIEEELLSEKENVKLKDSELKDFKEKQTILEQNLEEIINIKNEIEKQNEDVQSLLRIKDNEIEHFRNEKCNLEQELEKLNEDITEAKYQEAQLSDSNMHELEVKKWKEMAEASERQLNEALKVRADLEEECGRLYGIETRVQNQEHLERDLERMKNVSEEMENVLNQSQAQNITLEEKYADLKKNLYVLQEKELEITDRAVKAEQQLQEVLQEKDELKVKCELLCSTEDKLKNLKQDLVQKNAFILNLKQELSEVTDSKSNLEAECKRLLIVESKLRNQDSLELELKKFKEKFAEIENSLYEGKQEKQQLENENMQLETAYETLKQHKDIIKKSENENALSLPATGTLQTQIQKLEEEKLKILSILDEKTCENSMLKAETIRLVQIISEQDPSTTKTREERQFQDNDAAQMAKETVANLSKIIKDKDVEIEALKQKTESILSVIQNSSAVVETSSEEKDLLNQEIQRLNNERAELIKTVQVKHHESVQYHNEIQRLTAVLNQELKKIEEMRNVHIGLSKQLNEKQQFLLKVQNELLEAKQRIQHLEKTAIQEGHIQNVVEELSVAQKMADYSQDLQSREGEIEVLRSQVTSLQNQLLMGSQQSSASTSCRDSPLLTKEVGEESPIPEGIRVQVEALQAECSRMADTLLQEQTRNKYLQNEVQEQYEKESVLLKELERLRQHLVLVEEGYTQEALRAEEIVKDLQSKLTLAEERIKNSSTAYTSASIRANQHVESLQGQARLIAQQRDDIQQKLSAAEDQVQHHSAALRNLQIVLEQFQKDKEREVNSATERLQQQLQVYKNHHEEMSHEISSLKVQLSETKEGLSAAARLGEQLDKKTDIITSLKEEVSKLNNQLQESENRVQTASLNVEGKIDRNLVKNVVLGYFMAPQNTKGQVLRIVATVLDFNQEERDRVGLDSSPASSGWFKSLLQPGKGPPNMQSLSEAFVRFLENESRPQPQLRLLPEGQESTQGESRSDSPNSSAGSQRRSPLLLSEVHLPTFTQFPVGRNSSSILKDVLKDS